MFLRLENPALPDNVQRPAASSGIRSGSTFPKPKSVTGQLQHLGGQVDRSRICSLRRYGYPTAVNCRVRSEFRSWPTAAHERGARDLQRTIIAPLLPPV